MFTQFSAITPDRVVKGYTLGSGEYTKIKWATGPQLQRCLNVIRQAADQNPASVSVETTAEPGITLLRTNLNGTAYVLWIK